MMRGEKVESIKSPRTGDEKEAVRLSKLRAEMHKAIADAGKWRSDMHAAQIALHGEREKSKILGAKIKELAAAKSCYSAEISDLKKVNAALSGEIKKRVADLSASATDVASLREAITASKDFASGLKRDLADVEAERSAAVTIASKRAAENEKLASEVATIPGLKAEITAAIKENTKIRSENEMLKVNAKIAADLRSENRKLTDRNKELEKITIPPPPRVNGTIHNLEIEVAGLRSENDKLKRELDAQ